MLRAIKQRAVREGKGRSFHEGTGQQHQRKDATLIEPHKIDGILITQSKQKALARTEKKQNANSVHNAKGKDTVT